MKNKIIKSNQVYTANHGWLKSRHIFSFAEYIDYDNMGFGNMRVFNDDIIDGNSGFGLHPHSNMEILTIMLSGEITHSDDLGNKEVLKKGFIQTMSAGIGILHSEENKSKEETHLYQIWFLPKTLGKKPTYRDLSIDLKDNKLNLLCSDNKDDNVGFLDSDVKVYRGTFDKSQKFSYDLNIGRGFFIYIYYGELQIGDDKLEKQDQLRYIEEGNYTFKVNKKSDFLLIYIKK